MVMLATRKQHMSHTRARLRAIHGYAHIKIKICNEKDQYNAIQYLIN